MGYIDQKYTHDKTMRQRKRWDMLDFKTFVNILKDTIFTYHVYVGVRHRFILSHIFHIKYTLHAQIIYIYILILIL